MFAYNLNLLMPWNKFTQHFIVVEKRTEPTGSSMYCVKGESEKTLHGSESGD